MEAQADTQMSTGERDALRLHPSTKKRKPLPPHWYRTVVGECPVCGSDKGYRERVYGERPEQIEDRYVYLPDTVTFDNCIY